MSPNPLLALWTEHIPGGPGDPVQKRPGYCRKRQSWVAGGYAAWQDSSGAGRWVLVAVLAGAGGEARAVAAGEVRGGLEAAGQADLQDRLASLLQQTPQHKSVDLVLDSELTKLFYQNLQQLSIEFNQALSTGQRETLRRICHKIKGGAASFGETTLAELAAKLQQQLLSDVPMDALKHSCQYFAEFIQQFGDRNA